MTEYTGYLLGVLLVSGGITILLRAFPFLLFGRGNHPPKIIDYIGKMLSPAAIAMLVMYCFACYIKNRPPLEHHGCAAEIISAVIVIALQLWKRNPLLSILAGTAVYMILVQNGL